MLGLLLISSASVEQAVYGTFEPLGVPSQHIPGPYTNWRAKGVGTSFSTATFTAPAECTEVRSDENGFVFTCPKSGTYTVTSSNTDLSYDFVVGEIGTEYIWYIVFDGAFGTEYDGYCGKTSLCYASETVKVRVWVVPARESDAYPMNEDEFGHLLSEPSENAALITRRFFSLGEFPVLIYGGNNDAAEFVYNEQKNYWETTIGIDLRFPETFAVKGHEVSDFFGNILDLSGELYAVPVGLEFGKLFVDATDTVADETSVIELCGCYPNVGAMLIGGQAFVTMSAFESSKHVKMNGDDGKLVSIGFSPNCVIAATDSAVYCGQAGVWRKVFEGKANVVRSISSCCTAPTLSGGMSAENDMVAFLVGENQVYLMKDLQEEPILIQAIADLATKVYDFRFNSQTLLAVAEMKDTTNPFGYIFYDIKLGTHHVLYDKAITKPKVQLMDNGGIFVYGSRLVYSLDLTILKELKVPDFQADEEIQSLTCDKEVFAFTTNKQKLYIGTLIDQTMVTLWSPSESQSVNLFFKNDLLYAAYYDQNTNQVKTQYLYTVRKSFDEVTTFCVNCPDVGDYVFLDLHERLEFTYTLASFHNESLMASVQSPSFAKVTNSYQELSYSCGQLIRVMSGDNSSVIIEPPSSASCNLLQLNVTIEPMGTFGRTVAEVLEEGNGNGIVRFVLSEPNLIHYMNHFDVSVGCRATSYLRIVYKNVECDTIDEDGNENECQFQVLYGTTQFRPQIFLEDGITSIEITEDFALIPEETYPDGSYTFMLTADGAKCTRPPQTVAEMGNNWSKITYQDCFHGDPVEFDTSMPYEILNSTHNGINFKGDARVYKFRLVLLGFHDTYCLHTARLTLTIRNRAMKTWEIAVAVCVAIMLMANIAVFVFWRSFAHSFTEFYIELVRTAQDLSKDSPERVQTRTTKSGTYHKLH